MQETAQEIEQKLMRAHVNFRSLVESDYKSTNLLEQYKYDLARIETSTRGDIAKEKDPVTQKPMFSNEALREGELLIRLNSDEKYKQLLGMIGDIEDSLRETRGQIEIHKNFMSTMKMCIELRREV